MVATFGDVVYESSRAFADDEEEEFQNQSSLSFDLVHTPAGEKFLEKGDNQGLVFCAFVGKVAVGFGDGFVSNEKDFELLAQIYMVGQGDSTFDMYLNRPKKKPIARIFLGGKSSQVVFALFNTHGVPRYLANEVVEMVSAYIQVASRIVIFHSDTLAYYQTDDATSESKVFYVASSKYSRADIPSSANPLTPPNVIGGVSAAVLSSGEMSDKPALLLAAYGENELIDSISLKPFAKIIRDKGTKESTKGGELAEIFSQLELSIGSSVKTNVSPVVTSNLYI